MRPAVAQSIAFAYAPGPVGTLHREQDPLFLQAPSPFSRSAQAISDLEHTVLAAGGVKTMALPARSPNLNAFAERWVRSAKEECLSKLILFGEAPLSRTLAEFSAHYHGERNHQGKGNKLLFPDAADKTEQRGHAVECRQRLGGLLKFYARAA